MIRGDGTHVGVYYAVGLRNRGSELWPVDQPGIVSALVISMAYQ